MSNDKTTLADAQPGGRVRLGVQALNTSEGARRYVANFFATQLGRNDFGDYILTELAADFACALAQHLSAQPSPGGQDALPRFRCAGYDCSDEGSEENTGGPIMVADPSGEWVRASDALAARQPVGEPEIWVSPGQLEEHKRRPAGQGSNYLPTRLACEGNFTQPLYAAPPAQAVDLGQQQDAARWRAIAPHLQVEWDEDELLKRWTWIDFKSDALSVPTRSRKSYASLNEAMDAVIDSQAVGNG